MAKFIEFVLKLLNDKDTFDRVYYCFQLHKWKIDLHRFANKDSVENDRQSIDDKDNMMNTISFDMSIEIIPSKDFEEEQ